MKSEPKTLLEAIKHFADPNVTHELMVSSAKIMTQGVSNPCYHQFPAGG